MTLRKWPLIWAIMMISIVIAGCSSCSGRMPGSKAGAFSIESSYIQESGEHLSINAEYPVLKGFPGADQLNAEIREKVEAAATEVRNAALELEGREGFVASLNSNYQYFHNKNLASLWMNWDNYTGGAHGLYWMDSYTFNTDTDEIYTFPGLFLEGADGAEYVTNKILEEITGGDYYFETAADKVIGYENDYPFFINGEELIVYFQLYELAPYVAGMQSFSFSVDELESFLKPEIAIAMEGKDPPSDSTPRPINASSRVSSRLRPICI
ncbi:MAG TPA: hypothetical protein DCK81_00475 [Clostridiales bacterium UBA9856]|nr:hypothetical protein [Clostridiales bacterium UBA9856]